MTEPQWWEVRRRVSSGRPATYRCPFCNRLLHAMSDHVLIAPEGDSSRRRHAHVACVARAREAGRFLTYEDWRALQDEGRKRRFWPPRRR